MLSSIFSVRVESEPEYEDVRALPHDLQVAAWRVLEGRDSLPLAQAIQLYQMDLEEAARFARLYGRVNGLVFAQDQLRWVERERPEWRRRVR